MTERFQFSSDGMTPEEGFAAYRTLYAAGSDVLRAGGDFHARVHGVRLDGALLFERELTGLIHERAARVSEDGFEHFALHLVLEGTLIGGPESRFERAGPGDLVLVDTRKASRTEAKDLHVLTASVAREAVEAAAGQTDRLHGRIVSAPDTLVLRDLMLSILRHAADLPAEALPGLTRAFVELLAATLDSGASAAAAARRVDFAKREAAVRHISAHLADRSLDAEAIALATGQSRSGLYRVFERDGGVARFVMARRLAAVRDALENGSQDTLAVLAARFGFSDESHMGRRFTQAYGRPAGVFRREVASDGGSSLASSQRRWAGWMVEIA